MRRGDEIWCDDTTARKTEIAGAQPSHKFVWPAAIDRHQICSWKQDGWTNDTYVPGSKQTWNDDGIRTAASAGPKNFKHIQKESRNCGLEKEAVHGPHMIQTKQTTSNSCAHQHVASSQLKWHIFKANHRELALKDYLFCFITLNHSILYSQI